MAVTMTNLAYGRDADGRTKLLNDLKADIGNAKKELTGSNLTAIITAVDNNWSGADAEKFKKELKEKAESLQKSFEAYSAIIESSLTQDATGFAKMQSKL